MVDDKKTFRTSIGNFVQREDEVFIADTVNPQNLIVPAEYSNTGKDQELRIKPNAVIYSGIETNMSRALEGGKPLSYESSKLPSSGLATKYLNDISLVMTFAKAYGDHGQLSMTRRVMSDIEIETSSKTLLMISRKI
jgi:hypothetical protein